LYGIARPPGSGNADGEGGDGHELLVALAAVAPHEHGEAAGLVEDGEAVMPGVRLVGDALLAGGDERPDACEVGPARLGVRRHHDQPARHVDRHEGLRREFVALEQLGLERPVGRLGLEAERQAGMGGWPQVAQRLLVVLAPRLVRQVDDVAERRKSFPGQRLRVDLHGHFLSRACGG
jgi:hypothetical protein